MEDSVIRSGAFVVAILPPFIILSYFIIAARMRLDADYVWHGFGFGAGAAFPSIMVAKFTENLWGFGDSFYEVTLNTAFFGAAVPEEMFKLVALLAVAGSRLSSMKATEIFVLSVAVATGFACLENVFYVVEDENWQNVAALRAISAVPGHAFVGAVMGCCLAQANRSNVGPALGLAWYGVALIGPILLHGGYDVFVLGMDNFGKFLPGTPQDMTQTFAILFIVVMVVEGVLAHAALRIALGLDEETRPERSVSPQPSVWARAIQSIVGHALWWGLLGVGCLVLGLGVLLNEPLSELSGTPIAEGVLLMTLAGFCAIAILHGIAFFALAGVLVSRAKGARQTVQSSR